MNCARVVAGVIASLVVTTRAEEPPVLHASDWKKAAIEYRLYSGQIPDTDEPTISDAKVSLGLSGRAARDLFNHLGRDRRDICVEPGTRIRFTPNRKVTCLRKAKGEYQCAISVDLKSGETVVAMVC